MKKYLFITVLFIPVLTYAFDLKNSTVGGVIAYVIELLNLLVPILVAGALVLFFWGLSRFVISAGNEAELKKGKDFMVWGILALFILFSYNAIISIFGDELEIGNTSSYPFLPGGSADKEPTPSVNSTITFP